VIHRDAAIVEQGYTKVMLRGVPRFLIDTFDRFLKEKTMEGLFRKEGNAARMKNSQDCANLSDAERFRQQDGDHRGAGLRLRRTRPSGRRCRLYWTRLSRSGSATPPTPSREANDRRLLVIVKAKFFSHSAEQKIKAARRSMRL
ncbi:hypothetical protein PRIPAC_97523, partial [Pristionchus pacificus]|uniref:Uncharacterized protein n=1 Tax=Pristionchus pacificus TaxID=54126 RepID=A0A2A6D289_PRIPA